MTTTTKHFLDRAKERSVFKSQAAIERDAWRAYQRGKIAQDFRGREKEYLLKKESYGCQAIAFNGSCYIFSEEAVAITRYSLPDWFGRPVHYNGKQTIRDFRRYCKMNMNYPDQKCSN